MERLIRKEQLHENEIKLQCTTSLQSPQQNLLTLKMQIYVMDHLRSCHLRTQISSASLQKLFKSSSYHVYSDLEYLAFEYRVTKRRRSCLLTLL